jgi:cytochrome c-type biogenesis protein CcmH/NrfG
VACRSIGRRLAGRSASQADNRDVLLGLGTVCLTFAVSSAIDWTWFIPGVAAPALLAAGWLAGVERRARPAVREHSRRGPVLAAIITVLAIGTILAGYEIWRPLHAQQLSDAASAALASGDGQTALADAQDARSADPDSLFPLQQLSAIYWAAGERGPAEAELVQATRLQPSNPQSWSALGGYLVCWGHQLQRARTVLLRATALDFTNAYNEADLLNSVTNPDAPSQRALRKQLCANVPA